MTHYYDEHQPSDQNPSDKLVTLDKDTFYITTDNGVFAKDGLDKGTELLIESVEPEDRFLDLGCGHGVVSVAHLRRSPGKEAVLVDTNMRAVRLARKNVSRYDLDATVKQSHAYDDVTQAFTDILSNPPLAAGKTVCHEFIDGAPTHLVPGGRLSIVAPHNKGGKSLKQRMQATFGNVSEVDKSSGFRVYQSTND